MAKLPSLRTLLGRAQPNAVASAAEVAQDRDAAVAEVTTAENAVLAAEDAYRSALLTAADDALRGLDDARRDAARRLDRARALVAAFDVKLEAAQDAERQAEVDRLVSEASERASAFQHAAERDLPAMGSMARTLLRLKAEAELAREAAQAALQAAGSDRRLPSCEAFRTVEGRPRRELACESFEAWVHDNGDLAPHQDEIRTQADGGGFVRRGDAQHSRTYSKKRRFTRSTFLAAEPDHTTEDLAKALRIPGVRANDAVGWDPLDHANPVAILAALDRLERVRDPEGDSRQPQIEIRPLGPAFEVVVRSGPRSVREDLGSRQA